MYLCAKYQSDHHDQVSITYLVARRCHHCWSVQCAFLHSFCTQNVFVAWKMITIFNEFPPPQITPQIREVLSNMRDRRQNAGRLTHAMPIINYSDLTTEKNQLNMYTFFFFSIPCKNYTFQYFDIMFVLFCVVTFRLITRINELSNTVLDVFSSEVKCISHLVCLASG